MALNADQQQAVAAAFIAMVNHDRDPVTLSPDEIAAKVQDFDLAIEGFIATVNDMDLSERQQDWLLRQIAHKRYEVKHG